MRTLGILASCSTTRCKPAGANRGWDRTSLDASPKRWERELSLPAGAVAAARPSPNDGYAPSNPSQSQLTSEKGNQVALQEEANTKANSWGARAAPPGSRLRLPRRPGPGPAAAPAGTKLPHWQRRDGKACPPKRVATGPAPHSLTITPVSLSMVAPAPAGAAADQDQRVGCRSAARGPCITQAGRVCAPPASWPPGSCAQPAAAKPPTQARGSLLPGLPLPRPPLPLLPLQPWLLPGPALVGPSPSPCGSPAPAPKPHLVHLRARPAAGRRRHQTRLCRPW